MEYRGLPAFRFGAIIFHQYGEVNHASQPRLTQTFLNFSFSDGAASYPKLHSFFFFWIRDQNKQREYCHSFANIKCIQHSTDL